jgi:dienelactone hydrolase
MAQILLLHSVLGIRQGVTEAADRLREAGHIVHVPDLFEGAPTLDSYEPALARIEHIGVPTLIGRARAAAEPLGPNVVYAGFSLGAALAAGLAARRPGARGALLFHGAPNPASIGATSWPSGVPLQIHFALGDPGRNPVWIDELATLAKAGGSTCEVFDYPGASHLFTDPSLPAEYEEESAALLWSRAMDLLARVDAAN